MAKAPRSSVPHDPPVVTARAVELSTYGLTQYWLAVSKCELQALQDGVVSTALLQQIQALLTPGREEG